METPARFTYSLNGSTRVFPIPSIIKGDNYCRIEVDSAIITDRTLYDIVNNSIVFTEAPLGEALDVLVVQSEEGISALGTTTSIDILAGFSSELLSIFNAIEEIQTVATRQEQIVNLDGKIVEIDALYDVRDALTAIYDDLEQVLNSGDLTQENIWHSVAAKKTANSYANEEEDVFVKEYTSNDDGTYTATNITAYSAKHWFNKAAEVGSGYLKTDYNFSDLSDFTVARTNLDVYSKGELDLALSAKLDITQLGTNINLYPCSFISTVDQNAYTLVTSLDDARYNTSGFDMPSSPGGTSSLSASAADDNGIPGTQYLGKAISEAGLLIGSPGILNIPTIGDIRRSNDSAVDAGAAHNYASFYFKVLKRDSNGNEELIATSGKTAYVQPISRPTGGYVYEGFNQSAIFQDGNWNVDDRIVLEFWADTTQADEDKCAYEFRLGGNDPVRTLIPATLDVTARPVFHGFIRSANGKSLQYERYASDTDVVSIEDYEAYHVKANINYEITDNKLKEVY